MTDDSEMAICLAHALASNPPPDYPADAVATMYAQWLDSRPFSIGEPLAGATTPFWCQGNLDIADSGSSTGGNEGLIKKKLLCCGAGRTVRTACSGALEAIRTGKEVARSMAAAAAKVYIRLLSLSTKGVAVCHAGEGNAAYVLAPARSLHIDSIHIPISTACIHAAGLIEHTRNKAAAPEGLLCGRPTAGRKQTAL